MKKMTRKAFNETPQFMIAIDYLYGKGAEYGKRSWQVWQTEGLEAKNIYEAMTEAERWMNEDVYMIHLLEKASFHPEYWGVGFKAVLANRGHGWHCHDEKHGESEDMGFLVYFMEYSGGFPCAEYKRLSREEC